jgi:aminocarboxymuconate-semialdehyde decarboxylase
VPDQTPQMPIVDVHAHVVSPEMLDGITQSGSSSRPRLAHDEQGTYLLQGEERRFGPHPKALDDMELRLADMDRQGVDVQLLAAPPMLFGYGESPEVGLGVSRAINTALVGAARTLPQRFQVLADLPMGDPALAAAEVVRLAAEPLVRGVQLGTHVGTQHLDEPAFEPVWSALEAANLAVLLHPYAMNSLGWPRRYHLGNLIGNPVESTVAIAALIFGGVIRRHEKLRFVVVHGGGAVPYLIGRWDHGWECRPEARLHIDEPPSKYLTRFYIDTVTHDRLSLEFLGRRVGWDRIVIGTDHPFDMAEDDPVRVVRDLALPQADEVKVLAGNAAALLRPVEGRAG